MANRLWSITVVYAFLAPGLVAAQKLEPTKSWEVGDKMTYNWVLNNKPTTLIDEVVAVTDSEVVFRQRAGDRTYEAALSIPTMAYRRGLCHSNGQPCEFSPALLWIHLPLEQGKKWSDKMTVTGETFVAEVEYDRKVGGMEKIKTSAGQFDALKVSFSGRIKSKDKKGGGTSTGKESGTGWMASVNGRIVPVRTEYKNSYGEKFTVELVTAETK